VKVKVLKDPSELGKEAAVYSAEILNRCIAEKGNARLLLSTGASQFDTLKALLEMGIDWSRVEMFHLDEYIDLPDTHPASFRRYLRERFVSKINLKQVNFVNGEGNINKNIEELSKELGKEPIDLGLIGIGENAHIAFNDPPADFDMEKAYIIVNLNDSCKNQQVREGWFPDAGSVPKQAISMSVSQILKCRAIVSCVPYKVKAKAIKLTLENDVTNLIPATALKKHNNFMIFLDAGSASLADTETLNKYK
jgi:glucosamine-6-phosphate deaminase